MIDRQVPFDLQSEIGVLGSVILMPKLLGDVSLIVRPQDFYDDANRKLYGHLLAMFTSDQKIDDTLLVNRLKTSGDFEAIGGAAYLAKVANAVPNAAHAIYYAEIVREKSRYREIIMACTCGLRDAYDELPLEDVLGALERSLSGSVRCDGSEPERIADVWDRVIAGLQMQVGSADPPCLLSGLPTADDVGFVFADEELTILAARPGDGKTTMGMQLAVHHAGRGRSVLFCSLEMAAETVAARPLMAAAGVNGQWLRTSGIKQYQVDDLVRARADLADIPLRIWRPIEAPTVAAIGAMASRVKEKFGLRFLVIDQTSWIAWDDPRDQPRIAVAKVIKGVRKIAVRLKIPVLLLHQLNREGPEQKPRLSNLRESGAAEEDADAVAFLWPQPKQGTKRESVLVMAKNRNGAKGDARLWWREEHACFDELPAQQVESRSN